MKKQHLKRAFSTGKDLNREQSVPGGRGMELES
jgi:hypothetical protein